MFLIKGGLRYKSLNNEQYFKNYFVKEFTSESLSIICNFCVNEDTLVVLVLLGMDLKRSQPLNQGRFGLKSQRSLTTEDPKIFGYPKLLNVFL